MADIVLVKRLSGRLSFSATSATTAATDIVTNAELVAAAEQGPLKQLLDTDHADLPAFLLAAAAVGLQKTVESESTVTVSWGFAANRARLAVADTASPSPLAVRLSLAHSAGR